MTSKSGAIALAKAIYNNLPKPVQNLAEPLRQIISDLIHPEAKEYRLWMRDCYNPVGFESRDKMFLAMARFMNINRPAEGYYFEFGCHSGTTMRMAWRHFRWLFKFQHVAFDSFEGLPQIGKIDEQEIWQKGRLKTEEQKFVDIVTAAGMPPDRLRTVKGFYDSSLTKELADQLLPAKAAVIYVDCDLYESAVPVLEFCRPFLQRGTLIAFDDWNCFHGDPDRGERRAFAEFCARYPDLRFVEIYSTLEAKVFCFLGSSAES